MAANKTKATRKIIARRTVEVINEQGLHARPSAALANLIKDFDCNMTVSKNDQSSSPAMSVSGLLILEAVKGTKLQLKAEGPQASEAITAAASLFEAGFGEDHKVLGGEGTDSGVAVGIAHILRSKQDDVPHYTIVKANVAEERQRLKNAIKSEHKRYLSIQKEDKSPVILEFCGLLIAMLDDENVSKKPLLYIGTQLVNAEWALKISIEELIANFQVKPDKVWMVRADEYKQMLDRLLEKLSKSKLKGIKKTKASNKRIVVSSNIGPAEVIDIHRAGYAGFATSSGSYNSHVAILARGLGFPGIVALGQNALEQVKEDIVLVVDSDAAELHLKPRDASLKWLKNKAKKKKQNTKRVGGPPRTISKDGIRTMLYANTEFIDEVDIALAAGAEGIGLYRTEFLFLNRADLPSEEEQYVSYKEVVEKLNGLPVTFRTIDIGHDKLLGSDQHLDNESPLGIRAIRFCLREPEIFKNQLRALLRASRHGELKIMFPMISHKHEYVDTLKLVHEAAEELGMDKSEIPELGVMIEIPGSVFIMSALASTTDFFSVGTNDLIQYTLAVDRTEAALASLADYYHPGVIKLLNQIVQQANKLNIPVNMCGELAANPKMACLFCALGLRQLSMSSVRLAPVREAILALNINRCKEIAKKIVTSDSSEKIATLVSKLASNSI